MKFAEPRKLHRKSVMWAPVPLLPVQKAGHLAIASRLLEMTILSRGGSVFLLSFHSFTAHRVTHLQWLGRGLPEGWT
jgi:hypothetical protein